MLDTAYLVFKWFKTMEIETSASLNSVSGQTPRKIGLCTSIPYYKLISCK
jgi:hypothetical protein